MREIYYREIPTPDTASVRDWLQAEFEPGIGEKVLTPDGFRLRMQLQERTGTSQQVGELSAFVWPLQRTTYLKIFRWADKPIQGEKSFLKHLQAEIQSKFPNYYPELPKIDLSQQSIFAALSPYYPLTVKYFQKMPQGEYDLKRVYWWEQRWREGVRNPQQPKQVVFLKQQTGEVSSPDYDIIYVGGALGVIHAAVMAQLGYRVLLLERLPFGRMNREWNISRSELQSLLNLGLLTPVECESIIAREYKDGFHKFFDANNPSNLKAPVLHTPTVLNVALDAEKWLSLCGEKLRAAGGEIWDETEFLQVDVTCSEVVVKTQHLPTNTERLASGRLLVDAMGTASPIAWQLNGGRAFDSVCPTVGAVIAGGFEPGVWDSQYGDVLNSHGDISRGRQLIWELFPGAGEDIAIYLFHYHQVNAVNPGSLLEMYEDFFTILPEYRRCDVDQLVWKKPTFGYIPGHFSTGGRDRTVAFDRLIAIGDAASLQSPLVFTGFGSLVRNLGRLTTLLDTALRNNLLSAQHLNAIRAYQSNVSVTWLFSKGMMVPTGRTLPPQRINAMLNTFFGLLADSPPAVADNFIKDRVDWLTFNRLALKAASKNPALLPWIWQLAGAKDILRWLVNYGNFGLHALLGTLLGSWFPGFLVRIQPWLELRYPSLWLWLLAESYTWKSSTGSLHNSYQPPLENQESSVQELKSGIQKPEF